MLWVNYLCALNISVIYIWFLIFYQFSLILAEVVSKQIRIREAEMKRIHTDPYPQHLLLP